MWQAYKDQGVQVVGVNPGGAGGVLGMDSTEEVGGVESYVNNLHLTFPVGMEETKNYHTYIQAFKGVNPFPIDVVVGKDGRIAYIGREYDPAEMVAVIERELAK